MNNINIKEIFKTGIILFLITAISALLLSFVNKATAPVIAENKIKNTYKAMAEVMPNAADFSPVEVDESTAEEIQEMYSAVDSNGNVIGSCIIASANGYGGEIQVLVGILSDNTVTGIDILSHSETPGLGANAQKPDFKNQFSGKTGNINVASGNASENEINSMSGATITSKAVTKAVNAALEYAGGESK